MRWFADAKLRTERSHPVTAFIVSRPGKRNARQGDTAAALVGAFRDRDAGPVQRADARGPLLAWILHQMHAVSLGP